jgi:uncharacterized protein (DUF362 family)
MRNKLQTTIKNSRVFAAKLSAAVYDDEDEIARAVRRGAENLGWADNARGAFGKVIEEGARVVVKPNLVLHKNRAAAGGGDGILPLVTNQSLIKTVVAEILKANPAQVLVGDAPVQSCDFDALLRETGLGEWAAELQKRDDRFKGIRDFRRTICRFENGVRLAEEICSRRKITRFSISARTVCSNL